MDLPTLRAPFTSDDWIDVIAAGLYEAERAEHPSRHPQSWDLAGPVMRADARYRAIAAHLRGNPRVKAVLVEVLAQTLATADGFIWPSCDARTTQIMSDREYAATVAQRRQGYRHKARLALAAVNKYLDLDAFAQTEETRDQILAQAHTQYVTDCETLQAWRHRQRTGATEPASGHDGEVFGDGRR